MTERQKSWLTLIALWLLLLVMATLRPLAVPDEGRYGEIGRWMLQSGDWLTPRLNGIPFFHKPPLLHWLEAMSLATFGVNAVALRLVPALHVGLMMVALYLSARRISTELIARRAGAADRPAEGGSRTSMTASSSHATALAGRSTSSPDARRCGRPI